MTLLWRELGKFATILMGIPTRALTRRGAPLAGQALTVRALADPALSQCSLAPVEFISDPSDKQRVRTGDVLVPARSTSCKYAIVPDGLDGAFISATLLAVRCLPTLDPNLLVAYFRSPAGHRAIEDTSQSGTHQMNITVSGLSRLEVPVPSREQQARLVALLTAAEESHRAAVRAADHRHHLVSELVVNSMMSGSAPSTIAADALVKEST